MTINLSKHFFIELSSDWSQLCGKFNWYSFSFFNLYIEKDNMPSYELNLSILGFHLFARYNTDKALKTMTEWEREALEGDMYKFVKVKKPKKVKKTKK